MSEMGADELRQAHLGSLSHVFDTDVDAVRHEAGFGTSVRDVESLASVLALGADGSLPMGRLAVGVKGSGAVTLPPHSYAFVRYASIKPAACSQPASQLWKI